MTTTTEAPRWNIVGPTCCHSTQHAATGAEALDQWLGDEISEVKERKVIKVNGKPTAAAVVRIAPRRFRTFVAVPAR